MKSVSNHQKFYCESPLRFFWARKHTLITNNCDPFNLVFYKIKLDINLFFRPINKIPQSITDNL